VVHISGTLDWSAVEMQVQRLTDELRLRYRAYPYLHEEMAVALAAADLVVARAGASTLGEFPALGLPSILAPYPYSGQHQEVNADYLAQRGAAVKLPDSELSEQLATTVLRLLQDPVQLAAMSRATRSLAQPAAAEAIGRELQRLAQTG
jgi:UDP-N-acetylglucosamine--N-acetylmuramyl-(pentapeptide) pyrophosphoryl-undecaprenol N-acetylglucosamine transferase